MGCFIDSTRWKVSRTNLHHINKPKSTIMKLKSMTSVITKSALVLAACAGLNAYAGPSPKAPKNVVAPQVEEPGALFDTIGATLETGYDTRYYFRGLYFADNTVWTGLSLSIPLTEQLSWGVGALYTSTVQTTAGNGGPRGIGDFDYSELDITSSLTYDAGFAKFSAVYTHYEFFDGFSGTNAGVANGAGELNVSGAEEIGFTVAAAAGPVNLYGGYFYDLRIGGSYIEVGADLPIEITSWFSLVPAVKTGYGFDYYNGAGALNPGNNVAGNIVPGAVSTPGFDTSGFTHILVSLSAPVKLTKSATLTPYVAWNFAMEHRNYLNATHDNEVYGGVKLSVTF